MRNRLVCLVLAGTSVTLAAQQRPRFTLGLQPTFAHASLTPTLDPADDVRYGLLAPSVYASHRLVDGLSAEAGLRYATTYGAIEPYRSLSGSAGLRYYLRFPQRRAPASRLDVVLRKHFALYGLARYRIGARGHDPTGDIRLTEPNAGFGGGIGTQLYLGRALGLASELVVYQSPPGSASPLTLSYVQRVFFGPGDQWPEVPPRTHPRARDAVSDRSAFAKPEVAFFLEPRFGFAPDVEYAEENGVEDRYEYSFYYGLAGGAFLPHGFEAGARVTLLDAWGAIPFVDVERGRYYFAGAFVKYDLPILDERWRMLVEANVNLSNYTYDYELGHRRRTHLYAGFAGEMRYVISPRVYASAAMNFWLTTDDDRATLACNYPSLGVVLVTGRGNVKKARSRSR